MVKNPPDNAGDMDLIPGLERSPGERNGSPLQCSCRENPMDTEAWWATVSPWGRRVRHNGETNRQQMWLHLNTRDF